MTRAGTKRAWPALKENLALWIGFLGPAVLWGIQLQLNYALVPWVCVHGRAFFVLHLSTLFFFILTASGGAMCARFWKTPLRKDDLASSEAVEKRSRFMAMVGMMMAALFALLILAQGCANFFINPCQQ
jgi:hypothetical protein